MKATKAQRMAAMFDEPIRVRGVLAGAYRGRDLGERELRTHVVRDGAARSLCGRIEDEHLVDRCGADPAGSWPTCPLCSERLSRMTAKAIKNGLPPPVIAGPPW